MRWVARVTAHHHGSKINHNYISSNLSHQINSKFEIIVTDFICPRRLKTFFCLDLKTWFEILNPFCVPGFMY